VKQWLKWLLWSLLVLTVMLGGAVTVLSTTQWGLQWVTARVTGAFAGELSIASIRGRLIGPVRIQGLTYHSGAKTLKIASVAMDWRPSALLAGTMHITHFDLEGVHFSQTAAPPPASRPGAGPPNITLPVAVKLDRLSIKDLTIHRDGHAPVRVDAISLAAHADRRTVHIDRLTVAAPRFNVAVHGSVRPRGAYPMEWHSRWAVRPADMKAFSGTLSVSGSLKALDLTQHLNTPVRIDVQGHIKDVMKQPAWRARVSLLEVKARAIRKSFPPAQANGEINLNGDLHSVAARGRLSLKTQVKTRTLPIDSRFELAYKDAALTIGQLKLQIPDSPTQINVTGRISGITGAPRAALQGSWNHLVWPPTAKGTAAFVSENGRLDFAGTPDDYTLGVRASLDGKQLPPGTLEAGANGNRQALTLTDLQVHALEGTVSGRGTVAWRPQLSWRLHFQGSHLNPAAIRPDYPGQIGFTVAVSGSNGDQGLAADINLERLQGKLREYPVEGRTHISLAGSQLDIHRLSLASGKTSVSASGRIGKTWDLKWKIDSPDIHALYPKAHGALNGHGHLGGQLERPAVKAGFTGHRLGYGAYRLKDIQASLDVDASQETPSTLTVKAFGVDIDKHSIEFIHLTGSGTVSDHHLDAAIHTPRGVLSVALAGGLREGRWAGSLGQLDLISRDMGYWHLNNAVPISIAQDRVQIERLCWQRKGAHLCGHGAWRRGGDWLADVALKGFQLRWLQPFLTFQTTLAGTLDADLAAQRKDSKLSGTGQVTLNKAVAETALPDGTPIAVTVTQATLKAKTRDGDIHSALTVSTAQGGRIDGELTIPLAALPVIGPPAATPPPIKGRVTAQLTDLKILPRLAPTVENTRGKLTATLDIGGTLAKPQLAGTAHWTDGSMDIPRIGIHVTALSVSAKSPDGKTFSLTGSARSGGGSMHIDASGQLPLGGPQAMTVKITSKAFEVVKIPEAQALATSDITLKLSATSLEFSGTVTIPRAKLQPRDISSAVRPSSDVTLVNGPVAPKTTARSVSGTININLGRNVSFKGFGLTGKATGSITVQEQPKQPTLGYGSLNITGKYKAYGQDLDIQQGRLSYVGSPIDNPGLNVRAVRRTGSVTAGIHVTGTLQTPHLAVFSQPPMDDANALSYLLLGRPINQASTKQGNTLANAATALGLSGGDFLAKKIGHMFGIEDVKVESANGGQTASLVLGKYLTPDLYISYGVGLLRATNTLQLRYQISTHWELKAQSGLYNGGDILYTIDTH